MNGVLKKLGERLFEEKTKCMLYRLYLVIRALHPSVDESNHLFITHVIKSIESLCDAEFYPVLVPLSGTLSFDLLSKFTQLRRLSFGENSFVLGVSYDKMSTLRELTVETSEFEPEALLSIATQIEVLKFASHIKIASQTLYDVLLPRMTNLRVLVCPRTIMKGDDLSRRLSLPALRELDLSAMTIMSGDEAAASLTCLTKLETLSLAKLKVAYPTILAGLTNLTHLDLSNSSFAIDMTSFTQLTNLTRLELNHRRPESVDIEASSLASLCRLKSLGIVECYDISREDIDTLYPSHSIEIRD